MESQKGLALYLSIIIMIILLSVVLGISAILLGQFKIIGNMEDSVVAFYAAETGIEYVLNSRSDLATFSNGCEKDQADPCSIGDAKYYVDADLDCGAPNACIKSVGTYKNSVRALQVSY